MKCTAFAEHCTTLWSGSFLGLDEEAENTSNDLFRFRFPTKDAMNLQRTETWLTSDSR
jgi:hypothetical protein